MTRDYRVSSKGGSPKTWRVTATYAGALYRLTVEHARNEVEAVRTAQRSLPGCTALLCELVREG